MATELKKHKVTYVSPTTGETVDIKPNVANAKKQYSDNERLTRLWLYSLEPSCSEEERDAIREEIVVASQNIAKIRIRQHHFTQFASEEELMQEAALKVLKDYDKFNKHSVKEGTPRKLSAFVFLTTIITNHLLTFIYKIRKQNSRTVSIENPDSDASSSEELMDKLTLKKESQKLLREVDEPILPMLKILARDSVGLEILKFLGYDKINREDLLFEIDKKDSSLTNRLNVRTLMKHLHQLGYETHHCKIYLQDVKKIYSGDNKE
jgi:DNA-directed RNA polymerase specialized sigma24 family protein